MRALTTGIVLLTSGSLGRAGNASAPEAAEDSSAPPVVQDEQTYSVLYTPFRTDRVALSPDGRYIAYTVHENATLSVAIVEADHPDTLTFAATLMTDSHATAELDISTFGQTPARVQWMAWASPTRLILETNRLVAVPLILDSGTLSLPDPAVEFYPGEVVAIDLETKQARTLATTRTLGRAVRDPDTVMARPMPWAQISVFGGSNLRNSDTVQSLMNDPESPIAPKPIVTVLLPQIPTVLGFDPADHQKLVVLTESINAASTLLLDTTSGKTKPVDEVQLSDSMVPLLDRQGRFRTQISTSTRDRFPHEFESIGSGAMARWKPIGKLVPLSGKDVFALSPENYFGERAIPLGYSVDGGTLFHASNAGRDTFGVYGLDLRSGNRTDFAIELGNLDLYEPASGVFPDVAASMPPNLAPQGEVFISDRYMISQYSDSHYVGQEIDLTSLTELAALLYRYAYAIRIAKAQLPAMDRSPLVFDPFTGELAGVRFRSDHITTLWATNELRDAQAVLEATFPGRNVEICDWDENRERCLALVHSITDSGAFFLFDRKTNRLSEFVRRAPWLDAARTPPTIAISFEGPDGQPISGLLTFPLTVRTPAMKKVPMVVHCQTNPWQRVSLDHDPDVQALVRMGVAVLQVNPRGTWGFGIRHRTLGSEGYVPPQIEDIVAAIDHIVGRFPVNTKRVAIMGEGLGGHLALRAVQAHPDRFRCGIAVDAPISLKSWKAERRWDRDAEAQLISSFFSQSSGDDEILVKEPESVSKPVCILGYRGDDRIAMRQSYPEGRRLVAALQRTGVAAEFVDLGSDYVFGLPSARAKICQQIEEFLNTTIYDYSAKAGNIFFEKDETEDTSSRN